MRAKYKKHLSARTQRRMKRNILFTWGRKHKSGSFGERGKYSGLGITI